MLRNRTLIATAGALLLSAGACADDVGRSATYIERLGHDTLAIETMRWTDGTFEGTVVVRSPETALLDYWGAHTDGRMLEYGAQWRVPGADPELPPISTSSVIWQGDTAIITRRDEDGLREVRAWSPPDAVPLPGRIPPPPLLAYAPVGAWRRIIERVTASPDAHHVLGLDAPTPRAAPQPSVRWGEDSVGLRIIDGWTVARLDGQGEIRSISGHGTTMAIDIELATSALDLHALALEYAARDARGDGFGLPSPPARVRANVGEAAIVISYSRPARRGREIWGGLVPYGQVWRTGANLATHFTTSHDLLIGNETVPAGTYTLWMVIRPDAADLIVSRLTELWGTQYRPEEDLARIPTRRASLAEPVERFTIAIARAEGAASADVASLNFSWDRTRFSVPVRTR